MDICANILSQNMLSANCLSIKDLANLRLVNWDFKNSFDHDAVYYINQTLLRTHPFLDDISKYIIKSMVNIPEFERVLNNLIIIKNRKYKQKYSYLFKQELIRFDDILVNDKVNNTIIVMNKLYKYVFENMAFENQKYCNTNIILEVAFWYRDFMHNYCLKSCGDWYLQFDIKLFDKIYYKKNDIISEDIFMLCILTEVNVLEIYKIFAMIQTENSDGLDEYILNNDWYLKPPSDIRYTTIFIKLFIQLYDIIEYTLNDSNEKIQIKSRILFMIMTSIVNIFEKGEDPIIKKRGFKKACLQKATEMISDSDLVSPINFQNKFINLFKKMSEIVK